MASLERHRAITHKTVGRINVTREPDGRTKLELAMWSLSPEAILTRGEVALLIERLRAVNGRDAENSDDPHGVG